MNYYERHLGDYCKNAAHLSLLEHGVYVRLMDVYYTREAPIPDSMAARLIAARTEPETQALQVVLQEFFELRDGHWHQNRCDQEIATFKAGEPAREAKKENEETRMERHRRERANLFKSLTNAGLHAPWNIGISELRKLVESIPAMPPATAVPPLHATETVTPATQPATATAMPATATHSPLPSPSKREISARISASTEEARAQGQTRVVRDEVDDPVPSPSPAGLACKAMRAAGLEQVNPGDPRLLELLKQGATIEEFAGLAAEAVTKQKGFAWVMVVLQNRRAEAAAIKLAAEVTTHVNGQAEATQAYLQGLDEHRKEASAEDKAAIAEKLRAARTLITSKPLNGPPPAALPPP